MIRNILVLCIGNICRSPMAAALLKRELPDLEILSAGIGALMGKPADPCAVQLMVEKGIDISNHRAQQVLSGHVSQAQLILVMDLEQKQYIEQQFTGARGKVFRIGEASKVDIPDPYRRGVEDFRASLSLIEAGVKFWGDKIKEMN